jgi:ubiquinone/menaquinone biosynthesis C-methylase UbiE
LPPFATASRYEVPGKSVAYAGRNPARAARELVLLQQVWPGRRGETVLDLPCGAGRLLPLLADTFGHRVVQADGALAMLRLARAGASAVAAVRADALHMPFHDRTFDGVVMFRFLHHLAPEASRRAIAEACRTARRFVVVSFFHPCSFHHLQRRLKQLAGGTPTRFALRLPQLATTFAEHGFVLHKSASELPFARDLWVAAFVRAGNAGTNAQ